MVDGGKFYKINGTNKKKNLIVINLFELVNDKKFLNNSTIICVQI